MVKKGDFTVTLSLKAEKSFSMVKKGDFTVTLSFKD